MTLVRPERSGGRASCFARRFTSSTLSVARTCPGVIPVRTINSSTPEGRSSSWPRSDRSRSESASSARVAHRGLARVCPNFMAQGSELLDDVVDVSTRRAPSRIKRWQPRLDRLSAGPGTAKTSRFCSIACRAVESEPLRGVASTTRTPRRRSPR